MKSIAQVEKFSDKKFQKAFGVNQATFSVKLEVLEKQFRIKKAEENLSNAIATLTGFKKYFKLLEKSVY